MTKEEIECLASLLHKFYSLTKDKLEYKERLKIIDACILVENQGAKWID